MSSGTDLKINGNQIAGYLHPLYAQSLFEWGVPRDLPRCKGRILERQIVGFPWHDAMSCYPLFACGDWGKLAADVNALAGELVSLTIVTDPFGEYAVPDLKVCFKDLVIPFKEHFVVDLARSVEVLVHPHHHRYARKALGQVDVEICQEPGEWLDDWTSLYGTLIERHGITGITVFSKECFVRQFTVPGIVAIRAVHHDATVGMLLWYVHGDVAYYHLGAYSPDGYRLHVSFALFWRAIEYFAAAGLRWLNLGAGAGATNAESDGLTRFKRGWSSGTRTVYLCGRILDHEKYSQIVKAREISTSDYFPAYRKGEFR